MEQITLGKAIWFLFGLIPAIFGALLQLAFRREKLQIKNANLAKAEPLVSFLFGVFISYFLGGACIEQFGIDSESFTAYSINVLFALFGIGILNQMMIRLPSVIEGVMTQIPLAAAAVWKKFLG